MSRSTCDRSAETAVDSDDRVYVSNVVNNRIVVFDASGNFLTTFGSFGAVPGQSIGFDELAWDSDGNLYVADYGNQRIQKFAISLPPLPEATPIA